jgi:hypothetical protein
MKTRDLLAFSVPPELRERAEAVIEEIRRSSDPRSHRSELIEVIVELTRAGLQSYFLLPLERAAVDSVAYGTAKLGVTAAGRTLPTLVRRVVATLSEEQLRTIVDFLDESLFCRSEIDG